MTWFTYMTNLSYTIVIVKSIKIKICFFFFFVNIAAINIKRIHSVYTLRSAHAVILNYKTFLIVYRIEQKNAKIQMDTWLYFYIILWLS